MNNIKIATLGNCQTMALCWYIRRLNLDCTAKWIAGMLADYPFAKGRKTFKDQIDHNIYDKNESMSYLREVDYLIYQKIEPKTCNIWNHEKIATYVKNDCKLISVSYMMYDTEEEKFLNGMKQRASNLNIDIPAHKLVEKHGSKITMQQNNHPHAFYFLELMREICKTTGWTYYKDDQYQNLIKEGYPFG